MRARLPSLFALALVFPLAARADPATLVLVQQGRLLDANDQAVSGQVTLHFTI